MRSTFFSWLYRHKGKSREHFLPASHLESCQPLSEFVYFLNSARDITMGLHTRVFYHFKTLHLIWMLQTKNYSTLLFTQKWYFNKAHFTHLRANTFLNKDTFIGGDMAVDQQKGVHPFESFCSRCKTMRGGPHLPSFLSESRFNICTNSGFVQEVDG